MSDDRYKGGSTVESRWGCGAAALVGIPVFAFLFLAEVLGDCAPDTACKKGFLSQVALPTLVVSVVVGLVVYWAIRAARRNSRD
jgi:hypothetical protein